MNERRSNHTIRNLVILGNHLSMWAGVPATTPREKEELMNLFDAWDSAIKNLRSEFANKALPVPTHSDTI